LPKFRAPAIPPQRFAPRSASEYGKLDLPIGRRRVGSKGESSPGPKYASVMLMMKNWRPALGGALNLFHFFTRRVALGMLLLTLSFHPWAEGSSTIVPIG
jgi:hypothetical protein